MAWRRYNVYWIIMHVSLHFSLDLLACFEFEPRVQSSRSLLDTLKATKELFKKHVRQFYYFRLFLRLPVSITPRVYKWRISCRSLKHKATNHWERDGTRDWDMQIFSLHWNCDQYCKPRLFTYSAVSLTWTFFQVMDVKPTLHIQIRRMQYERRAAVDSLGMESRSGGQ